MIAFSILLFVSMVIMSHGAPAPAPQIGVRNSVMQPEVHATGLVPMITGTNVPESEEEIEAPIDDQNEVNRIRGLAKQTAENGRNPEKAIGGFIESNPGFMSTVETLRLAGIGETTPTPPVISTSPHPIFTLPNGIPTISIEQLTTTTVKQ